MIIFCLSLLLRLQSDATLVLSKVPNTRQKINLLLQQLNNWLNAKWVFLIHGVLRKYSIRLFIINVYITSACLMRGQSQTAAALPMHSLLWLLYS